MRCSVSRIQGKSVTRSREGKLSAKMDPELAPPPELADKGVIVCQCSEVHTFSAHVCSTRTVCEMLTLLCLCSPQKTGTGLD